MLTDTHVHLLLLADQPLSVLKQWQGSPVGPIDADLDLVRRVPDLLRGKYYRTL